MAVVREPTLNPVNIEDLRPTQITVGMREVEAETDRGRSSEGPTETYEFDRPANEADYSSSLSLSTEAEGSPGRGWTAGQPTKSVDSPEITAGGYSRNASRPCSLFGTSSPLLLREAHVKVGRVNREDQGQGAIASGRSPWVR